MSMELIINHERTIDAPAAATIRDELLLLGDDDFAILARDELTFIQTLIDPDEGIVLEYQVDSTEQHFAVTQPPTSIEAVIEAFVDYAAGGQQWLTKFEWEPIELDLQAFSAVLVIGDELADVEDPLDWEAHAEMPYLALAHFAQLYGLLVGDSPQKLLSQFRQKHQSHPAGTDGVHFFPCPSRLVKLLAELEPDRAAKLAGSWRRSPEFPDADYDNEDTEAIIADLSAMAEEAISTRSQLVIAEFQ